MLDYINVKRTLHTRGVNIDEKQYLFVLSVVMGERVDVAYGMMFDTKNFKRAIESDECEEYLASIHEDAQARMMLQDERQLQEILNDDYKSEIQAKAMDLEDYSFTTGQVIQILQNLLHDRAQDLENSSVRDIISLINTLANQGALQSGDNFSSHFIQIYPPFDVVCTACGREFDIVKGLDGVCPHCHQVYRWSEDEQRFYPQPTKL
jgi:hypothetical protein